METEILFREGICSNVSRKEDNGNCSEEQKFMHLVDFLDHDDTVTADV